MAVQKMIYFVRHGQSEDNAMPVFQAPNSPLNEKGRMQAALIAQRLMSIKFDVLISSSFDRAKQTAEIISNKVGKVVEYSDLFVERIKPSSVNSKPHADAQAHKTWHAWLESLYKPGVRIEDGENLEDIIARVDKAMGFLSARTEHSIVVVTHGYFLRTIVARLLFRDSLSGEVFKRFHECFYSLENTALTVLRQEDVKNEGLMWRLWIYNDHTHLAE